MNAIYAEELHWGCAGIALAISGSSLAAAGIAATGTPEQVGHWVARVLRRRRRDPLRRLRRHRGERRLGRPVAAHDRAARRRRVGPRRREGLHLQRRHRRRQRGRRDRRPRRSATAARRSFIVEKDTPGFAMGKKEDKLGIRASQTARARARRRPRADGEPARRPRPARAQARARAVGRALACRRARSRRSRSRARWSARAPSGSRAPRTSGRSTTSRARADEHGPLLEQQRVQQVLADVATEIDAARLLVYRAAWMGRNGVPMTGGQGSMSKLKAGDVAMWATTALMDLVGPEAGLTDHPLEKWFRDAKIYQLFEGTAQVQRLVISRMQVAERRRGRGGGRGARRRGHGGSRRCDRGRRRRDGGGVEAPRRGRRAAGRRRAADARGRGRAGRREGAATARQARRALPGTAPRPRRVASRRRGTPMRRLAGHRDRARPDLPHICGRARRLDDGRSPLLGIWCGVSGDRPIPCMQRRIPGRSGERGTQVVWGESRGHPREAPALSAPARQLTPQADERELSCGARP